MLTRVTTIAAAVMTLSLLGGCGPSTAGEQDSKKSKDSSVKNSVGSQGQGPASQASGPNRCALLTDDEVRDAIGPHGPGSSDVRNEYGLQSCWWTATTAQKFDAYPNGWFDSVEVVVFDKLRESWAREQAQGEPVKDFMEGAQYDANYGQMWFPCAHDRFCMVRARLASSKKRDAAVRQLAQLVEKRLR